MGRNELLQVGSSSILAMSRMQHPFLIGMPRKQAHDPMAVMEKPGTMACEAAIVLNRGATKNTASQHSNACHSTKDSTQHQKRSGSLHTLAMLPCELVYALHIRLDIELSLAASIVHVANFAENCSLCPALQAHPTGCSGCSKLCS